MITKVMFTKVMFTKVMGMAIKSLNNNCHPDESRDPDFPQAPNVHYWVPTFVGMTG